MGMTATARVADGLRAVIDVNGRHTLITDEPLELGGTDTAPAPHELLPTALASCIATMIALYARRKQWELGEIWVDVDYDPAAEPSRFDVEIRLPAGLTDDQVRRLRRVAETCPVRRALEGSVVFNERITTDVPATRRAPASGRLRAATCARSVQAPVGTRSDAGTD